MERVTLGIAGPRGSGKTFAAAEIAAEWNRRFPGSVTVVPFAESLKKCAAVLCGISYEDALFDSAKEMVVRSYDTANLTLEVIGDLFVCDPERICWAITSKYNLIELPCTFGRVLQLLGTEILRDADPDIFVRTVFQRERPGIRVLIVPDIRFENECGAITACGGHVFRINPVVKTADSTGRDPLHASEQVLTCIPTVIENDYTSQFTEDVRAWALAMIAK